MDDREISAVEDQVAVRVVKHPYRRWVAIGLVALVALALLYTVSCSRRAQGRMLVEQKCSRCHPLVVIDRQRGLTRAQWVATVDNMIARGADVTPEERAKIVDYLSRR